MNRVISYAIVIFLIILLILLLSEKETNEKANLTEKKPLIFLNDTEDSSQTTIIKTDNIEPTTTTERVEEKKYWWDSIKTIDEYSDFIKTLDFDTLELLNRPDKIIPKPKTKISYKMVRHQNKNKYYQYDYKYPVFDLKSKPKVFAKINNYIRKFINEKFFEWCKDTVLLYEYGKEEEERFKKEEQESDLSFDETYSPIPFRAEPQIFHVSDKILTVYYYISGNYIDTELLYLYSYKPLNFNLNTGEIIEPNDFLDINKDCAKKICWFMRRKFVTDTIPYHTDLYPYDYFDPGHLMDYRITNTGLQIIFQVYFLGGSLDGEQIFLIPWKAIDDCLIKNNFIDFE